MTSAIYVPQRYIDPVPFDFHTPSGIRRTGYGIFLRQDEIELASLAQQDAWATRNKSHKYAYKRDYTTGIDPNAYRDGKIAEIATARLIGSEIDLGYRDHGDSGIDCRTIDKTLDVKTKKVRGLREYLRQNYHDLNWYKFMNVAYEPRDRHYHEPIADIFVSTLLVEEEDLVLVLGYRDLAYYKALPLVPSRRTDASWLNREWQAVDVEAIGDLISK